MSDDDYNVDLTVPPAPTKGFARGRAVDTVGTVADHLVGKLFFWRDRAKAWKRLAKRYREIVQEAFAERDKLRIELEALKALGPCRS